MSNDFPQREQLRDLLDRLLANDLTADDARQLNELLAASEEARREYVLYLSLEGRLAWEASQPPEPSLLYRAELVEPASPAPLAAKHDSGVNLLKTTYWRQHRVLFAGMALALTLLFWVGVGWFVFSRFNGGGDPSLHPTSVASITAVRGAAWAEGATAWQNDAALNAGDKLELAGGFVEITFEDGAVVLLEAPAEFTIETRGAGTLAHGRLFARLQTKADKPEAIPFSISTPLAQIIDQGTEFGVEATEGGATEVEVFSGLVEVTPRSSDGARPPQPLRLRTGQSAYLAPGEDRFVLSERRTGQFVLEMPEEDYSLIAPASMTYSTHSFYGPPERLIDGSGLLQQGPPHQWRHEFLQPHSSSWSAPARELPVTFTFDLGQEYDLQRIWIWNLCNPQPVTYVGHNTREVRVEISADGRVFSPCGTLTLWACTQHPTPAESFEFNERTRYVRFIVLSNHGANEGEVQLSEVRFEIELPQDEKPKDASPEHQ